MAAADIFTLPSGDAYGGMSAPTSGGGSGYPAWLAGKAVNAWDKVGSNRPQSVDSSLNPALNPNWVSGQNNAINSPWAGTGASGFYPLSSICAQWSAGAWCEEIGEYKHCGGGHAGRFGNDTIAIGLLLDNPAWALQNPPSGSIARELGVNLKPAGACITAGGYPLAVHNYNLCVPLPNGDVVVMPGALQWEGAPATKGFVLSAATRDWDLSQTFDQPAGNYGYNGAACYDPVRDCIWAFHKRQVVKYVRTSGHWVGTLTYIVNNGNEQYYLNARYDSTRNLIFILDTTDNVDGIGAGKYFCVFDPGAPSAGMRAINIAGVGSWGDYGFAFDKNRDRFLVWNGVTTVYVLTPPALPANAVTGAWTLSTLATTTAGVAPLAVTVLGGNPINTFGRFFVSDRLNTAFGFSGDEALNFLRLGA